jgi:hypothetical protein
MTDLFEEKLAKEFLTTEDKIVVEKYSKYIGKDRYSDFVIDVDHIFKDIGIKKADKITPYLKKHFVAGKDYQQHLVDKKTKTYLTPNTFKDLCFYVQTNQSKSIRDKYERMEMVCLRHKEEVYLKTIDELDETREEILELKANNDHLRTLCMKMELDHTRNIDYLNDELTKTKHELNHYLNYSFPLPSSKEEMQESVIVVQLRDSTDGFKVLSSGNYDYSRDTVVMYVKCCYNMLLLENLIHHRMALMFGDYDKNGFTRMDFDALVDIIDILQADLDNGIEGGCCKAKDKFIEEGRVTLPSPLLFPTLSPTDEIIIQKEKTLDQSPLQEQEGYVPGERTKKKKERSMVIVKEWLNKCCRGDMPLH